MANNFFLLAKEVYARKFLPCSHDPMNYESCLELMLPQKLLTNTAPHIPALLPGSIWPLTNPSDNSKVFFSTFIASCAPSDSLTIISFTTVLMAFTPGSSVLGIKLMYDWQQPKMPCVPHPATGHTPSGLSQWHSPAVGAACWPGCAPWVPPLVPGCQTKGQGYDRHQDAAASRLSSGSTLFGKTTSFTNICI